MPSVITPWRSQFAMCWLEMRSVARFHQADVVDVGHLEQPTPCSTQRTT